MKAMFNVGRRIFSALGVALVLGWTGVRAADVPGVWYGALAWGDYDGDGLTDLVVTGATNQSPADGISQVWRNLGRGNFKDIDAGLPSLSHSAAAWADYDLDGRLDLVLNGWDRAGKRVTELWRNTATGFAKVEAGLPATFWGALAWGDYDNDGRPDLALTGWSTNFTRVAQVWRNTPSGFVDIRAGLPGVDSSALAWGDYNGDGRLDLALSGTSDSGDITQIWRNTGSGFVSSGVVLPGTSQGALAWGDYNSDGRQDLLVVGNADVERITQIWRNTGSGFVNSGIALPGLQYASAAWGDYNRDGKPDLLLTGDGASGRLSQVWRNTGSGFVNADLPLEPVYWGSAGWGDVNYDGWLDLALVGDGAGGRVFQLWQNTPTDTTPLAVTGGSGSVGTKTALVFGTVNPIGVNTFYYFEFGPTPSYGSYSITNQLLAGSNPVEVASYLTGLAPGTAHHYRIVAFNGDGSAAGSDREFSTSATAPSATTLAEGTVTSSSAVLNGSVMGGGLETDCYFEYGLTTSYGSRTATQRLAASGVETPVSATLTGLSPVKTHYYRLVAVNSLGTSTGGSESFATKAAAPAASTLAATSITTAGATLRASINPNGAATTYFFQYGRTPSLGSVSSSASLAAGTSSSTVSRTVSGLAAGAVYHYRVVASNSAGSTTGAVTTLTTSPTSPTVATLAATAVNGGGAVLNGTVNPNGAAASYYFEYGLTTGYGTRTPTVVLAATSSVFSVSAPISGLSAAKKYYYRLVANNSVGNKTGTGLDFTTTASAAAPVAATLAASGVTTNSATLNGTVNPNGVATSYYFEYGATTAYGMKTGTNTLAAGTNAVAVNATLSGLGAGTTRHYRLVAVSAGGTSQGGNQSFTTTETPQAPVAMTLAASGVTTNSATLNGTVNPNGAATTYWFEHAALVNGPTDPVLPKGMVGHWAARLSPSPAGAPVDLAPDHSGNGLGAMGAASSRPIFDAAGINGQPAWAFDGNDVLRIPGLTNQIGDFTLFIVARDDGSAAFARLFDKSSSSGLWAGAGPGTKLPGTIIGTAGSYGGTGNTREKAFDGSVSTFFDAPAGSGAWVGLDFGTPVSLRRIGYAPRSGWAGRMVGGKFQVSNDPAFAADVMDLATISSAPAYSALSFQRIAASGFRYARYLAPNGGYGNVSEVEFHGVAGDSAPWGGGALSNADPHGSFGQAPRSFSLMLRREGTSLAVWINGTNWTASTVSSSVTDPSPAAIGDAAVGVSGYGFKGHIAEVALYSQALSLDSCTNAMAEFNSLYGTGPSLQAPPPAQWTATPAASIPPGSPAVAASAVLSELAPGSEHLFRLVASNAFGVVSGAEISFIALTTPQAPAAPVAVTLAASGVTTNSATLNGTVNPNGVATSYYFEYGATTAYGSKTGTNTVAAGTNAVAVNATLSGLGAGTTRHYRLVASNAIGVVTGQDVSLSSQGFAWAPPLPYLASGTTIWADIDGDSFSDVLLFNEGTDVPASIWRNIGGSFADLGISDLPALVDSAAAWADFDSDGQLDFAISGNNGTNYVTELWRNSGTGFEKIETGLPGTADGSIAWADFDGDGRVDIALTGATNGSEGGAVCQVWRNTEQGFVLVDADLPGVQGGTAAWGDYDNDGRPDLIVTGSTNGADSGAISAIFHNNAGGFSQEGSRLLPLARSTAAWCDFDNDGLLDFAISGFFPEMGGVAASQLWRNTGNGFELLDAMLPGCFGGTLAWADYDHDGRPDLMLTGSGNFGVVASVFCNLPSGFVEASTGLTSSGSRRGSWADVDGDGRLDIVLTGISEDGTFAELRLNILGPVNVAPSAPEFLQSETSGSGIRLRWHRAKDTESPAESLTYSLRVGTTPGGSEIVAPGAAVDGTRRLQTMGNHQLATNAFLVLPPGTYYWSVQSVDAGYVGSAFAPEQTFTIAAAPVVVPALTGIQKLENGSIRLTFSGAAGAGLKVVAGADLSSPVTAWTELGLATETSPGVFEFVDTAAAGETMRFYGAKTE